MTRGRLWTSSLFMALALACVGRQGTGASGSETSGASSSESSGPSETNSSSTSTETGEPDPETETGMETETETGDPGSPCESDDDCFLGSCIEGSCFSCSFDWDCNEVLTPTNQCEQARCNEGVCSLGPRECSAGPSCSVGWCDPEAPNLDDPPGWPCQVEYCELYDGIPELTLTMTTVHWTPPAALDIGGEVEVLGVRSCGHTWFVRDLATNELLLLESSAHESSHDAYEAEYQAGFERSWAELTAPLVVDYEDHGACGTVETECGPRSRGSVDVQHGQLPEARVLDHRIGWASGGYFINAKYNVFGEVWCVFEGAADTNVSIMRDACEGNDCPAATFDAGCEPELEFEADGFDLQWDFGVFYLGYSQWALQCQVVGASEDETPNGNPQQIRELDCFVQYQPTVVDQCDH